MRWTVSVLLPFFSPGTLRGNTSCDRVPTSRLPKEEPRWRRRSSNENGQYPRVRPCQGCHWDFGCELVHSGRVVGSAARDGGGGNISYPFRIQDQCAHRPHRSRAATRPLPRERYRCSHRGQCRAPGTYRGHLVTGRSVPVVPQVRCPLVTGRSIGFSHLERGYFVTVSVNPNSGCVSSAKVVSPPAFPQCSSAGDGGDGTVVSLGANMAAHSVIYRGTDSTFVQAVRWCNAPTVVGANQ